MPAAVAVEFTQYFQEMADALVDLWSDSYMYFAPDTLYFRRADAK